MLVAVPLDVLMKQFCQVWEWSADKLLTYHILKWSQVEANIIVEKLGLKIPNL